MPTCFVIQPFDNGKFDKRYQDCFSPAIKNAGFEPYRVDQDATSVVPIDSIHERIGSSAVCLADITTDNPNVWYELGYAMSAGKPVVMLCSSERTTPFPFDVRHRTIVAYKTDSTSDFVELQSKITERLKAHRELGQSIKVSLQTSPILPDRGLDPHEFSIIGYLLGNRVTPDHVESAYEIQRVIMGYGHTAVAVALGLDELADKGLIELVTEEDHNGAPWYGYRLSASGMQWARSNKDRFSMRQPARSQRSAPSADEYDPFADE